MVLLYWGGLYAFCIAGLLWGWEDMHSGYAILFFHSVFFIDLMRPVRYRFYFGYGLLLWLAYVLGHGTAYAFRGLPGGAVETAGVLLRPLVLIPAGFVLFYFFTTFNDKRYEG